MAAKKKTTRKKAPVKKNITKSDVKKTTVANTYSAGEYTIYEGIDSYSGGRLDYLDVETPTGDFQVQTSDVSSVIVLLQAWLDDNPQ